jgi:UDP:flavonoid glycosyltransferase YjiC (YdhE family)
MAPSLVDQVTNGVQNATINGSGRKPRLIVCAAPADGHALPILKVCRELAARGYPMTFITGEGYREQTDAIGGDLVTIPDMDLENKERLAIPAGMPRMVYDLEHFFINWTPTRWEALKTTLETLREQDSSEELVIIAEPLFMGTLPLVYGAPLPKGFTKRPRVVKLGICPYIAYSVDVGPGGPGLPPDSTESGRARNALIQMMMMAGPMGGLSAKEAEILKSLGAHEYAPGDVISGWLNAPDLTLQMTPPSLEYPRTDLPDHVKFIGSPPPKPLGADFVYPSWWDEVTKSDKKVVMVTQGTVAKDCSELIIPTMEALAERDDLFVVAVLGVKGASLPDDVAVPANTRIIDYLSYDALLPHCAVFVCNGGYGGFMHGVVNAVPMVMAGATEEKPEVCMRGEWAGIAVNLRTGTPSVEQVRDGVDKILADPKYKARVIMVQKENAAMNAIDSVEKYIRVAQQM